MALTTEEGKVEYLEKQLQEMLNTHELPKLKRMLYRIPVVATVTEWYPGKRLIIYYVTKIANTCYIPDRYYVADREVMLYQMGILSALQIQAQHWNVDGNAAFEEAARMMGLTGGIMKVGAG